MSAKRKQNDLPFRLAALGIPEELLPVVRGCVRELEEEGVRGKALRRLFNRLADRPESFAEHPILGALAGMLRSGASCGNSTTAGTPKNPASRGEASPRKEANALTP